MGLKQTYTCDKCGYGTAEKGNFNRHMLRPDCVNKGPNALKFAK